MDEEKGILLFAHNNDEIDYLKIACVSGLLAKYNLNLPVAVVTDSGSHKWAKENYNDLLKKSIDKVITSDIIDSIIYNSSNKKTFKDTRYHSKRLKWNNVSRAMAFKLSPWNQTLMIDSDYLIMSNQLLKCFDSEKSILMNKDFSTLNNDKTYLNEIYLGNTGPRMYWATVVYFKKDDVSELFFDTLNHIIDHMGFYNVSYDITTKSFRNDHAFSIAAHILHNFQDNHHVIGNLPYSKIKTSVDMDEIQSIPNKNKIVFLVEKAKAEKDFYLRSIFNQDVHVMNKYSLSRNLDEIIEVYNEE